MNIHALIAIAAAAAAGLVIIGLAVTPNVQTPEQTTARTAVETPFASVESNNDGVRAPFVDIESNKDKSAD